VNNYFEHFDLLPSCNSQNQETRNISSASQNECSDKKIKNPPQKESKVDLTNKELQSTQELGEDQNMPALEKCVLYGNPKDDINMAWGVIGKMGNRLVGLDLQYGKSMAIFGTMGSGKSYLCGALTEMMAMPIKDLSWFPNQPSAVVIFNYRQVHGARFEYGSYIKPNDNSYEVNALNEKYKTLPTQLPTEDLLICAHNSMIRSEKDKDYAGLKVRPLLFKPENLNDDDWQLLLGLPNKDNLYVTVMRNIMERLSEENRFTIDSLKDEINSHQRLSAAQRNLALMRIEDLAEKYISQNDGIDWEEIVKPGRITILDFRKTYLQSDDALRLALICLRGVGGVDPSVHKFLLFDEFHEYYNEAFSDDLDKYRRMVRHNNISFCIATQNTEKVDDKILKSFSNKFIFKVDSSTWDVLQRVDPLLAQGRDGGITYDQIADLQQESGECFIKFDESSEPSLKRQTRKIEIRPRVTKHGGFTVETQ